MSEGGGVACKNMVLYQYQYSRMKLSFLRMMLWQLSRTSDCDDYSEIYDSDLYMKSLRWARLVSFCLLKVPRTKTRPEDLLLLDMRSSMISRIISDRFEFSFEEMTTRSPTPSCRTFRYFDMNCSFWLCPKEKLGMFCGPAFTRGASPVSRGNASPQLQSSLPLSPKSRMFLNYFSMLSSSCLGLTGWRGGAGGGTALGLGPGRHVLTLQWLCSWGASEQRKVMLVGQLWRRGLGAWSLRQCGQAICVCVVFLEAGRLEGWDCLLRLKSELVWLQPFGDCLLSFLIEILGGGERETAGRTSSPAISASSQQQNPDRRPPGYSRDRNRCEDRSCYNLECGLYIALGICFSFFIIICYLTHTPHSQICQFLYRSRCPHSPTPRNRQNKNQNHPSASLGREELPSNKSNVSADIINTLGGQSAVLQSMRSA